MPNKKAKGKRAKTRSMLTRKCSRATVNKLLQEFGKGTTVHIRINPAIHSGMPHRRYQGKTAVVAGKRGNAYVLDLKLGKLNKQIIVTAAHITPMQQLVGGEEQ